MVRLLARDVAPRAGHGPERPRVPPVVRAEGLILLPAPLGDRALHQAGDGLTREDEAPARLDGGPPVHGGPPDVDACLRARWVPAAARPSAGSARPVRPWRAEERRQRVGTSGVRERQD